MSDQAAAAGARKAAVKKLLSMGCIVALAAGACAGATGSPDSLPDGRLPVVAVLEDLDKAALQEILIRPKNALIQQYQTLFEFENVKMRFEPEALAAIATLALQRKVGARGLRMILEDLMLDLMYHLPSHRKVREFVVTKEMVENQVISIKFLEKAG